MSLRKDVLSWGLVVLVLLLIVAAALFVIRPYLQPQVSLQLGSGLFDVQVAQTEAQRAKGLSGVTSLGETDAMLFVYDHDSKQGVWMKDMLVPIDIIWLDANKRVISIVKNATPDTYPKVFMPTKEARYIVEVPAGTVDRDYIRLNRQAVFDVSSVRGRVE